MWAGLFHLEERYGTLLPSDTTRPLGIPSGSFYLEMYTLLLHSTLVGLSNSGYQAQRISDALVWIHQRLGLETTLEVYYKSLNYIDDIGGCEKSEERAIQSSEALHNLLKELGLEESLKKAHRPSTYMPFLGINFDTIKLEMSIPAGKLAEVREEVSLWMKRNTATKKT